MDIHCCLYLCFGAIKLFKHCFRHRPLHTQYFSVVSNRIFNPFSIFGNGRHLHKRTAGKNYAILKSMRSNNYCGSPKKIACACLKHCVRIVDELTLVAACKTPFYQKYDLSPFSTDPFNFTDSSENSENWNPQKLSTIIIIL